MNNNFEYLDDRITTVGQAITGWETQLANVNTTLTNSLNNLNSAAVKLTGSQTITGAKTFSGGATLSGTTTHSGALNCSGAATFTGTTKVPASSTAGTALQLAARGSRHIKLGDGTIIQWGYQSTSGASSITLPTAFSDANYALGTATLYNSNANVYTASIKTKSSSSFTYYLAASYGTFFWIAIGR